MKKLALGLKYRVSPMSDHHANEQNIYGSEN